jgi:hypothetical protein
MYAHTRTLNGFGFFVKAKNNVWASLSTSGHTCFFYKGSPETKLLLSFVFEDSKHRVVGAYLGTRLCAVHTAQNKLIFLDIETWKVTKTLIVEDGVAEVVLLKGDSHAAIRYQSGVAILHIQSDQLVHRMRNVIALVEYESDTVVYSNGNGIWLARIGTEGVKVSDEPASVIVRLKGHLIGALCGRVFRSVNVRTRASIVLCSEADSAVPQLDNLGICCIYTVKGKNMCVGIAGDVALKPIEDGIFVTASDKGFTVARTDGRLCTYRFCKHVPV